METVEITTTSEDVNRDVETLKRGLWESVEAAGGPVTAVPLVVFARNPEGEVVGGAKGKTGWRWLHLEMLWVHGNLRGNGLGRELVLRAEEEARQRGCVAVYTDTLDAQAPWLYESLGYRRFGVLEDFPVGSRRHFFTKRL